MQTAASAASTSVTKYTERSKLPTCANPVLNGTIKKEREEDLYAGDDHTQLAVELFKVAVKALRRGLVASRVLCAE